MRKLATSWLLLAVCTLSLACAHTNRYHYKPKRPKQPSPLEIPAGLDFFETLPGTMLKGLSGVPSGFFGEINGNPSDPIEDPIPIEFVGIPLCADIFSAVVASSDFTLPPRSFQTRGCWGTASWAYAHCAGGVKIRYGQPVQAQPERDRISAIVQRKQDVVLGAINDSATTTIQIVALSLRSSAPIRVTYGGTFDQFFDVRVSLHSNGFQQAGSMVLTRGGEYSGVFDSILPVNFQVTFTNTDSSGPAAAGELDSASLDLQPLFSKGLEFRYEPFEAVGPF